MLRNCIKLFRGGFSAHCFQRSVGMGISRVFGNTIYANCYQRNFVQGRGSCQLLPVFSGSRALHCTSMRSFSSSARRNIDFRPKEMLVTTSYGYWHERPEGVQMNVTYIDTASDMTFWEARHMPTILAMHGSPGTHKDLLPIVEPLAEMGARVIVPNFPGKLTHCTENMKCFTPK